MSRRRPISVRLQHCAVGDATLAALAAAVSGQPRTRTLNVTDNRLTAAGCAALAHALAHMPALEHADFSRNALGLAGARALAPALPSAAKLSRLVLQDCSLGDEALATLARALRGQMALETLRLAHNRAGTRAAEALAELLPVSASLRELDVRLRCFAAASRWLRGGFAAALRRRVCGVTPVHAAAHAIAAATAALVRSARARRCHAPRGAVRELLAGHPGHGAQCPRSAAGRRLPRRCAGCAGGPPLLLCGPPLLLCALPHLRAGRGRAGAQCVTHALGPEPLRHWAGAGRGAGEETPAEPDAARHSPYRTLPRGRHAAALSRMFAAAAGQRDRAGQQRLHRPASARARGAGGGGGTGAWARAARWEPDRSAHPAAPQRDVLAPADSHYSILPPAFGDPLPPWLRPSRLRTPFSPADRQAAFAPPHARSASGKGSCASVLSACVRLARALRRPALTHPRPRGRRWAQACRRVRGPPRCAHATWAAGAGSAAGESVRHSASCARID